MNPQYLEKLTGILEHTQNSAATDSSFHYNQYFRAVAAYVEGRIFAVYGQFGFALKLPPQRCAELITAQNGAPLRYFPNGHVKKGYMVLPERTLKESPLISQLVTDSIGFVLSSGPRQSA